MTICRSLNSNSEMDIAPACEPETKTAFRPARLGSEGGAEKLLNDVSTSNLLEVLT
jgi:hypothetical protein